MEWVVDNQGIFVSCKRIIKLMSAQNLETKGTSYRKKYSKRDDSTPSINLLE